MAQRDYTKALTKDEQAKVEERIIEVRKELGFSIGDPITYELLYKVLKWVNSRVEYHTDQEEYDVTDFWNTMAFDWLMLDDYLLDDCDGSGYVFISFCLRVLDTHTRGTYRASTLTETKEGHFICWVKATNGIIYQLENRILQPRTLKYMHEFGYRYLRYSDMTKANIEKDKMYNAENFVMKAIYNTPVNTQGNEPDGKLSTAIKATTKSKTLSFGLFDKVATTGTAIVASLASQADWKIVGLIGLYGVISLGIVYYIRSVTYEPLEVK